MGQQEINQLLGEWFQQLMPIRQRLGMLITYLGLSRATINLINTSASHRPLLNFEIGSLAYSPSQFGPFIVNLLKWFFTFMLWAF